MHLYIIYKAHYNLAMFPMLDYATPATVQAQGNNINFVLFLYSKDVFEHSFPTHCIQGLEYPNHSQQWRLHPWNCLQGKPPKGYILMSHH